MPDDNKTTTTVQASEARPRGEVDLSPVNDKLVQMVELWWANHFPGSVVARYTEAYNHAFAAKEALKTLVNELKVGE